ncbi:MAG: UDP-3-O-(3-hydroxymyristoyl)glucosamine N-acyltransferase [Planctomycetota bacterium]|nr:MAG: UDP-3-O-(3-hydroxymyristoyl)glucosamine N-acyltransferase [Planctomycetota bacterium]
MELTVGQLAQQIGADLVGDGSVRISGVGPVKSGDKNTITFVKDSKHIASLETSRAGAVLVSRRIEELAKPQLIVENVDVALIEVLNIFAPRLRQVPEGIDPTAKVARDTKIGKGAAIGPGVVIDDKVEIGENSVISRGCKIGENAKLGKNCRLDSNVVVYHNCIIGDNVVIQANTTIGSVGFGYSCIDGAHRLIPHNGGVVIEDFVEIGANCCVDRAKFGDTVVGAGTKIDNLVQIAHNVVIGKRCLIAGQVGIAGSSKLGDGVVLGGQVGVSDNIEIGDGAMIAAQSGVTHSVRAGEQLFGTPATTKRDALKTVTLTRRLPKMAERLQRLSERIAKLEAAENDKR